MAHGRRFAVIEVGGLNRYGADEHDNELTAMCQAARAYASRGVAEPVSVRGGITTADLCRGVLRGRFFASFIEYDREQLRRCAQLWNDVMKEAAAYAFIVPPDGKLTAEAVAHKAVEAIRASSPAFKVLEPHPESIPIAREALRAFTLPGNEYRRNSVEWAAASARFLASLDKHFKKLTELINKN